MARPKGSRNKTTKKEEVVVPENTGKLKVEENAIYIDNLPMVMIKVKELLADKKLNPGVVQEEDAGVVFINGEPCRIIDNSYLPVQEANLIIQTRRVVRENIKLQNLINNVI